MQRHIRRVGPQIKKFQVRRLTQSLLMAGFALFITACATPSTQSTIGVQHKTPAAHSNDVWQRVRNNFAMPDLVNDEVSARENYYSSRADYVGRMAARSSDFLYIIMNEVERRKMPSELALLPFVESAYVTSAQSSAKAAGLWQFMPATGRDFSLQQNRFADQRNDVIASTNAALDYLERLYQMFGDWHLALAAYNWGQGNVRKAVDRSYAAGGSGKYTDIKMPTETRQYVPKLQAIKNIVRNPAAYGISLPNIPNQVRHEAILVTRDIDTSTAAQLSGLSLDEFKRLNPAYKKPIIVAALNSKILVPANHANEVRRAFNDRNQQLATLTTYTTFGTESLDNIAKKYHTNASRLRELNDIPGSHGYVRADSTLIVPRTQKNDEISYLALNSSVRSITGDVGITDYNTYNTGTTLASNISGTNSSSSNTDVITASKLSKSGTGLVASSNDLDHLGELIQNAPSVAQNTRQSTPQNTSKNVSLTASIPATSVPSVKTTVTVPNLVENTPVSSIVAEHKPDTNGSTAASTSISEIIAGATGASITETAKNPATSNSTSAHVIETLKTAVASSSASSASATSALENELAKTQNAQNALNDTLTNSINHANTVAAQTVEQTTAVAQSELVAPPIPAPPSAEFASITPSAVSTAVATIDPPAKATISASKEPLEEPAVANDAKVIKTGYSQAAPQQTSKPEAAKAEPKKTAPAKATPASTTKAAASANKKAATTKAAVNKKDDAKTKSTTKTSAQKEKVDPKKATPAKTAPTKVDAKKADTSNKSTATKQNAKANTQKEKVEPKKATPTKAAPAKTAPKKESTAKQDSTAKKAASKTDSKTSTASKKADATKKTDTAKKKK